MFSFTDHTLPTQGDQKLVGDSNSSSPTAASQAGWRRLYHVTSSVLVVVERGWRPVVKPEESPYLSDHRFSLKDCVYLFIEIGFYKAEKSPGRRRGVVMCKQAILLNSQ